MASDTERTLELAIDATPDPLLVLCDSAIEQWGGEPVKADSIHTPEARAVFLAQVLKSTLAEVRALRAVVSKLPVTANGVVVAGGDPVWTLYGAQWLVICDESGYRAAEPDTIEHDPSCAVNECYSTREAALAAASAGAAEAAK